MMPSMRLLWRRTLATALYPIYLGPTAQRIIFSTAWLGWFAFNLWMVIRAGEYWIFVLPLVALFAAREAQLLIRAKREAEKEWAKHLAAISADN
jgi:hypothetical protein